MPEPTLLDGSSGGGYTVVNTLPGPIGALQRKQHEFGIVFTCFHFHQWDGGEPF